MPTSTLFHAPKLEGTFGDLPHFGFTEGSPPQGAGQTPPGERGGQSRAVPRSCHVTDAEVRQGRRVFLVKTPCSLVLPCVLAGGCWPATETRICPVKRSWLWNQGQMPHHQSRPGLGSGGPHVPQPLGRPRVHPRLPEPSSSAFSRASPPGAPATLSPAGVCSGRCYCFRAIHEKVGAETGFLKNPRLLPG